MGELLSKHAKLRPLNARSPGQDHAGTGFSGRRKNPGKVLRRRDVGTVNEHRVSSGQPKGCMARPSTKLSYDLLHVVDNPLG